MRLGDYIEITPSIPLPTKKDRLNRPGAEIHSPEDLFDIFGYCRVSTEKQHKEGYSIEAQTADLESYIMMLTGRNHSLCFGTILAEPEGISASKTKLIERPAGQELLLRAKKGCQVVFAKLDRSFRSLEDLTTTVNEWHRRGIGVHFADQGLDTTTPVGEFLMNIMGTLAQMESRMIGERTKAGHEAKRRRGNKALTGMKPKGFNIDQEGGLSLNYEEAAIGRLIRWYRSKGIGFTIIEDRIEAIIAKREGIKPRPRVAFSKDRTRKYQKNDLDNIERKLPVIEAYIKARRKGGDCNYHDLP